MQGSGVFKINGYPGFKASRWKVGVKGRMSKRVAKDY